MNKRERYIKLREDIKGDSFRKMNRKEKYIHIRNELLGEPLIRKGVLGLDYYLNSNVSAPIFDVMNIHIFIGRSIGHFILRQVLISDKEKKNIPFHNKGNINKKSNIEESENFYYFKDLVPVLEKWEQNEVNQLALELLKANK